MKIEKAIGILEKIIHYDFNYDYNQVKANQALQLGIEALKDKKYQRITDYPENQSLLPGETP